MCSQANMYISGNGNVYEDEDIYDCVYKTVNGYYDDDLIEPDNYCEFDELIDRWEHLLHL